MIISFISTQKYNIIITNIRVALDEDCTRTYTQRHEQLVPPTTHPQMAAATGLGPVERCRTRSSRRSARERPPRTMRCRCCQQWGCDVSDGGGTATQLAPATVFSLFPPPLADHESGRYNIIIVVP